MSEQEEFLRELHSMHDEATRIHARLTELDVRSGAVGAARNLAAKILSAINVTERLGSTPWDDAERMAANAWRLSVAVSNENGELPSVDHWVRLAPDVQDRWRAAVARFRS